MRSQSEGHNVWKVSEVKNLRSKFPEINNIVGFLYYFYDCSKIGNSTNYINLVESLVKFQSPDLDEVTRTQEINRIRSSGYKQFLEYFESFKNDIGRKFHLESNDFHFLHKTQSVMEDTDGFANCYNEFRELYIRKGEVALSTVLEGFFKSHIVQEVLACNLSLNGGVEDLLAELSMAIKLLADSKSYDDETIHRVQSCASVAMLNLSGKMGGRASSHDISDKKNETKLGESYRNYFSHSEKDEKIDDEEISYRNEYSQLYK